ncbi:MAG: hypothetical protein IT303_13720 [Dehalococcoidia bacterium]|nr:hypothetical protein [Dehalococcoidia bacterium]
MLKPSVKELLLQAIETERGGQQIYTAAIECASTAELREEWQKYLEETENHERVLMDTFSALGLDPEEMSPGRLILQSKAKSLVTAMTEAKMRLPQGMPELVAAECVVEAESKDHMNWELIGRLAQDGGLSPDESRALMAAHEQVEDQEDEHLYHTMGWARELWIKNLGMPAVIPPPEEQQKVTTKMGAARAEQEREQLLN